jgi:SEC-C motif protein
LLALSLKKNEEMEIVMASLLENWRNTAYGNGMNKQEQEALWQKYFALEKGFYEEILKDPKKVYEGSVKELAEKFSIDPFIFVGILDGIDESLAGYHNPIETMEEDTVVKIQIDPEKLYYNMVEAKASWLYELPQWDAILSEEKRKELYKEQKKSGTVKRESKKIYPNDTCPCGSGKKYKKCCMRKDEEKERELLQNG